MKNVFLLISLISIIISCESENNNQSKEEKFKPNIDEDANTKNYESGQILFKQNCAQCHFENNFLVAYPFQKIRSDYDLPWIFAFIRNSDSLIKARDIRATFVFELHTQLVMPKFEHLTDQQIIDILDYVDTFPIINTYNDHRKLPLKSMEDSIKKMKSKWKTNWDFKK